MTEKIKLGKFELAADDLRDLADAMDNPKVLPAGMKSIDDYAESLSNK